uniref:Uncharacterized protein n=1 Tax=Oryza sativa subsp. japonica TaxID=39947 RepID=Q8L652_ORYSJ|nr:hypothetical protein [Oryza sativa Japonica Group]
MSNQGTPRPHNRDDDDDRTGDPADARGRRAPTMRRPDPIPPATPAAANQPSCRPAPGRPKRQIALAGGAGSRAPGS